MTGTLAVLKNKMLYRAHGVHAIPIGEPSRLKRLKEMNQEFSRLKESHAFEMNGRFSNLYSIFPRWLYLPLMRNLKSTTIGMANIPGPSGSDQFHGKTVLEKYGLVGLQLKNASKKNYESYCY